MKKLCFVSAAIFALGLAFPAPSLAQGMMGFLTTSPDDAAIQNQLQEEREGKGLLARLSGATITCSQLTDSDFEKIGEYFMGQSIGDTARHIAMNEMMKRMMGEQGEEQMHIVMGKRGSGCDTSIAFPSQDAGFLPIMGMMGGWPSPSAFNQFDTSMMNIGYSPFGWIVMILFWGMVIAGIVVVVKWLAAGGNGGKSALDILKARYAKGEITKKEFEEKKKDIK